MNEFERKIAWKCRRGMLELDLIFKQFYQEKFACLNAAEQNTFDRLLDEFDPTLAGWILGDVKPEQPDFEKFINQYLNKGRKTKSL